MIQRKQTLFLLFAVIACAFCMFLPVGSIQPQGMGADTLVYNLGVVGDGGIKISSTCLPLFLLQSVVAVLSFATIFLFKNRKLQMSLCSVALLFNALWYVDYVLMFLGIIPIPEVEGKMSLAFAACLPLVSLILIWMAKKGVEHDEKLVKAADRIR